MDSEFIPKMLRWSYPTLLIGLLAVYSISENLLTSTSAFAYAQLPVQIHDTDRTVEHEEDPCIPSGDETDIQSALYGVGSEAVLCPDAVFELGETVYFTADSQSIYTEGLPTDDTRALLRVVGDRVATAVSAEGNDYVSLRNVIIDGNRPQLGLAEGALINFGRGILGRDAEGHVVEWVRAYEPRGWTVLYIGGPCTGALARYNELGPAGRAEYIIADGISLDCANSVVENNTIVDVTDGGIVIFQSPGALVANNTIRAETRIMFYGISMEDYYPLEGDFTGTVVTGNTIDAAGAMIREGIGMGPFVGCANPETDTVRSRGAVVTGNTLMGDHMGYGFVIGGVEDWTVTGNVDLSTHLTPEREGECHGIVVDPPAGFQYDPQTSSGTFQPEFEAAVMTVTSEMWPLYTVVSESCVSDLIGESLLDSIRAGLRGPVWSALESAPNGERIGQCVSIYEPPDVSDLSGNVGVELLPCEPFCAELRLYNLSDETADLRRAEFLLEGFPIQAIGLPDSIGPWEEAHCIINDFVAEGFQVISWFGFRPDGGFWGFDYPFEPTTVTPGETESSIPKSFHLSQNYPNPFNPSTTIEYTIPEGDAVTVQLNIYDLRGRLIRTFIEKNREPGRHMVHWDGQDDRGAKVDSGLYLYRIEAADFTSVRKMTIVR